MSWNPVDAAVDAAKSVGHAVADTGRAVAKEIYEDTGLKRKDDDHRRADAAKRGDQRRRELESQGSGLRGQTQGGYDAAAITSTTNWRAMGHHGIHGMLQKSVKPGGINDAGVALADLGKGLAQDHDTFHHELDSAIKSGWQGAAASAANNAAAPIADWGRQMGASLELTGNQMQLVSAAAQQAKETVPPPTSTNYKEGLLATGATMFAGPVGGLMGGAMDLKQQSDRAKADQERAAQVMSSVYSSTYVEADRTTPSFARPIDPTAPSDQPPPPPEKVSPPSGHVPPPGVPIGRGYQPPALRPSPPPPPSGFVPPPGMNPEQQQQQQQALAQQQAELARQRQRLSPMGTSQQGFDPSSPSGWQTSGGRYGGGSYGGGSYGGGQSGGGYGSVPFGPLGSAGGYGGSGGGGGGAGGRYGASGGGGGQSSLGPGGRAGVGGPGGSGEVGARGGGIGGAGARGAAGASGMPMGGGAGRGGKGEEDGEHRSASYLVNADNGNEIVGDLGKVAPPVIGES